MRTESVAIALLVALSAITVPGVLADNHDSFASAQTVNEGTIDGLNVPSGEARFYKIQLEAKEQVTFSTEGADSNLKGAVYGPDQATKLAENEAYLEKDTTVTYTANQNGTFYLKLQNTGGSMANHSLTVTVNDLTDRYELNDEFQTAATLSEGTHTDLSVAGSELDYYAVDLEAKQQLTISTEGATANLDSEIYAPNQATKLATNNAYLEKDTTVTYTANQDGTFYLRLNSTTDASTNYTLSVTVNNLTDRYELNDRFQTAATLSEGTHTDLSVAGSELDYYAVDLEAKEQVTFSTGSATANLDAEIYAPNQATRLVQSNAYLENDVSATYTANQDGTFYLRLNSTTDASANYTLTVNIEDRTDQFEPNDEFATATFVNQGTYSDLDIAGAELDYYKVSLSANQEITFKTEGASKNIKATLYTVNGTAVATSNRYLESDISLTHVADEGGTYYLKLNGTIDRSTAYTLRVISNQSIPQPPTASFTVNATNVSAGTTVAFDASGSSDDGTVISYEWDFDGDGSVDATGPTATYTYDASGTYAATLTVTDDAGATAVATQSITVTGGSPLNGPPGRYDNNTDGDISISELGIAAADFAAGKLSITALGQVAAAFAAS